MLVFHNPLGQRLVWPRRTGGSPERGQLLGVTVWAGARRAGLLPHSWQATTSVQPYPQFFPPELIFATSQKVVMNSDEFNVDKMLGTFGEKALCEHTRSIGPTTRPQLPDWAAAPSDEVRQVPLGRG